MAELFENDLCIIVDTTMADVTFEQAREGYGDRKFWVSFFVRPCCPPPAGELAAKQVEAQRQLVRDRADFTDDQKAELIALIDAGEAWYKTTPYWSKGAAK